LEIPGGKNLEVPAVTGTLDLYMAEINRFSILTADEEFRLAVRLKKYNDMEAAEKLVVSNLRFVVKIAHEYRNYGLKLADLVQEGNIGLMHAVKKFDPYKGYRLISYAVWWIRAYIQNYIIKSWSLVKIGTTQAQRKLFFKLSQARKKLEGLSEKRPEFAEIAETLGVQHNIAGALTGLNEKETFIIQNRVMADIPLTLQAIGDRYHITRERARQIEKQALRKLALAIPYLGTETKLLEA
jgi:RNA polymerase sigma-32 factor